MTKAQKKTENLPAEIDTTTSQFAIMSMEGNEISDILNENLDGEQLTPSDLESVGVPAGGNTTWTINTVDGEVDTKSIDGILIMTNITRAYWESDFSGGGDPPACSSPNGKVGIGTPGGDCRACPLNQFGSAKDGEGRGKACNEKRFLFMVTQDETLPIVIKAPAMSLKGAKKYLFGLTSKRKAMHSVYTRLTLEKDKNQDGIDYSRIVFTKIGEVEHPETSAAYAKGIKPHLTQVAAEESMQRD